MFQKEWSDFLISRPIGAQFPREMFRNRMQVRSLPHYLRVLEQNYRGEMDCFVSLFSPIQIAGKSLDTLFMDIDAKDLYAAQRKVDDALSFLDSKEVEARILIFSGKKGYHIYADFPSTRFRQPSRTIRTFIRPIRECVDMVTVGNLRQLVRVPYTMHPKTRLFAHPVEEDSEFDMMEALSPTMKAIERGVNRELREKLLDIDNGWGKPNKLRPVPVVDGLDVLAPPCVMQTLDKLGSGKPVDHPERLHVTVFLGKLGFSKDNIVSFFHNADDWNRAITDYQVDRVLNGLSVGAISCYSCSSVQTFGFCPRRCNYYPSINISL